MIDTRSLPPLLKEIAEVAGIDAALKLAQARGGTEVFIPSKLKPGHWLVDIVGQAAAEQIARHFSTYGASQRGGGARVQIPLGPSAGSTSIRRMRIDQMIAAGCSNTEIARECGVTTRAVSRRKQVLRQMWKRVVDQ